MVTVSISPWFCRAKFALISNIARQSLHCSINLQCKLTRKFMEPSYFAPRFYGVMQTLTRKAIEQLRHFTLKIIEKIFSKTIYSSFFLLLFFLIKNIIIHSYIRNPYNPCDLAPEKFLAALAVLKAAWHVEATLIYYFCLFRSGKAPPDARRLL